VIWIGGTISDLKRRYWNHKCNQNDAFYKTLHSQNLDWNDIKIELMAEMPNCKDRKTLSFAIEAICIYNQYDNPQVLQELLNNIDYYIDTNI
jgi:hypothetical protein